MAIRDTEGSSYTYAQLEACSDRIAAALEHTGVVRQDRVAICMSRRIEYVAVIFGILKAGAIYVPIFHGTPPERLSTILAQCTPRLCVVDDTTCARVSPCSALDDVSIRVVSNTELRSGTEPRSHVGTAVQPPVASESSSQDVAYIMYTSGSTGSAKGVTVTHQNVIDYAQWGVSYFSLAATDRLLSTAPFYFDMSTFDIHCAVRAGACLCVADERDLLFPSRLVRAAEQMRTTFWKGVAWLVGYLAHTGAIGANKLTSLEQLVFAGEVLPSHHLRRWMLAYPDVKFFNAYGPTECTGISCVFEFAAPVDSTDRLPIGRSCAGTHATILQPESAAQCSAGQIGELCISGDGVAQGYWNDAARTLAAFVDLPADIGTRRAYRTGDLAHEDEHGVLWLHGRVDRQIKYRGYRVELGEIEARFCDDPDVVEAAVILDCDCNGHGILVGFMVIRDKDGHRSVLKRITSKLPEYMIPRTVHRLERLPRNERGKVDMTRLHRIHWASRR